MTVARSVFFALLLCSGAGARAAEDDVVVQVTTDSGAYCAELTSRCETLLRVAGSPPPDEAAMLTDEGRRLCSIGHNRAGIMRLRRALSLLSFVDTKK